MIKTKTDYFITPDHENDVYRSLLAKIKINEKVYIDDAVLIVNVSPDYSSIITQRLRHALSIKGEILEVVNIEVPYPDETDIEKYADAIKKLVGEIPENYTKFIFVEAGIIRGGNYTMINELFKLRYDSTQLLFTALFENIGSIFQSDCVGEYYDDSKRDLTFYWEEFNNHWQWNN